MISAPLGPPRMPNQQTLLDTTRTEWRMRLRKVNLDEAARAIRETSHSEYLNDRINILKDISGPCYSRLEILDVGHNRIESIESIRTIHMPGLKKLWLNNNHIRSIKPLLRCHLSSLTVLWLNDNFILEFGTEGNFHQLKELYVQKTSMGTILPLMKCSLPELVWGVLSTTPGGTDEDKMVNVGMWEGRIRWKFRKMERVWMPLFLSHIQTQNTFT